MSVKVEIIKSKAASLEGKPSKGELKRKMDRLQELGERLTKLSDGQLGRIELPEDLARAVADARSFSSRAALRRQIQFIGRLMEHMDAAKIARDLNDIDIRSPKKNQATEAVVAPSSHDQMAGELIAHGVEILFSKYAGIFDSVSTHQISQHVRQALRNIKKGADLNAERSKLADKLIPLVPAH